MRRVTDAACCRCSGAVPQLPITPSLSLRTAVRRERNGENEGSLILPLFVLSSSPLHTSPRPPQITIPLSPLPTHLFQRVSTSPNQPTSSSINDHSQSLFLPIRPPLPSLLMLPLHPSPFPVPSSFPVSLSLSPPSSPFLTLPFPLSRYPCDLPQAFCFPLKGEVEQDDSIGSGRARCKEYLYSASRT